MLASASLRLAPAGLSEELERIVEAHFLASDLRQIIREEFDRDRAIRDHESNVREVSHRYAAPVQIFGRDYLPS